MPKIGGEWQFRIVRAEMRVGYADYPRKAMELFVLDKTHRLMVPISTKGELGRKHRRLKIDRSDPAFVHTNLDPNDDSYIVEDEAKAENALIIKSHLGWLRGALAEKYVIWSGRSSDPRLARGHNPSRYRAIPTDFMPVRDDVDLYHKLTTPTRGVAVGDAEYDLDSGKIFTSFKMWPGWHQWVFARAQQVWDAELTRAEKQEWIAACRKHQAAASRMLDFWIGLRRLPIDIDDVDQQARIIFTEVCVLIFVHYEPWHVKPLAPLAQELGERFFWWYPEESGDM